MPTNKERFNKKYGFKPDKGHSLPTIARLTGISLSLLAIEYPIARAIASITKPIISRTALSIKYFLRNYHK